MEKLNCLNKKITHKLVPVIHVLWWIVGNVRRENILHDELFIIYKQDICFLILIKFIHEAHMYNPHHDITEILLNVSLNTINLNLPP